MIDPDSLVGVKMHDMKKFKELLSQIERFNKYSTEKLFQALFKERAHLLYGLYLVEKRDFMNLLIYLTPKESSILVTNIMYNKTLYDEM